MKKIRRSDYLFIRIGSSISGSFLIIWSIVTPFFSSALPIFQQMFYSSILFFSGLMFAGVIGFNLPTMFSAFWDFYEITNDKKD